jgi:hypothetical protein
MALKRTKPMHHGEPPKRKTRIRQVGRKREAKAAAAGKQIRSTFKPTRWQPAVPQETSDELTVRSGGWCELALEGCLGRATDPCHRIKRGNGGRRGEAKVENNSLPNLMHGCRACHQRSHRESAEAYALGIRLKEGQDPITEPTTRRGVRCCLTADGGVVPVAPCKAAA